MAAAAPIPAETKAKELVAAIPGGKIIRKRAYLRVVMGKRSIVAVNPRKDGATLDWYPKDVEGADKKLLKNVDIKPGHARLVVNGDMAQALALTEVAVAFAKAEQDEAKKRVAEMKAELEAEDKTKAEKSEDK